MSLTDHDVATKLGMLTEAVNSLKTTVNGVGDQVTALVAESNVRKGERKAMYGIAAAVATTASLAVHAITAWMKGHA